MYLERRVLYTRQIIKLYYKIKITIREVKFTLCFWIKNECSRLYFTLYYNINFNVLNIAVNTRISDYLPLGKIACGGPSFQSCQWRQRQRCPHVRARRHERKTERFYLSSKSDTPSRPSSTTSALQNMLWLMENARAWLLLVIKCLKGLIWCRLIFFLFFVVIFLLKSNLEYVRSRTSVNCIVECLAKQTFAQLGSNLSESRHTVRVIEGP